MKEQLAAMTIIELVRTAHSYATSIQQLETYSALVTEMASRLEALNLAHIGGMNSLRSAISDRDQLATENAALKSGAAYFSYGSEHNFEWHKTQQAAVEAAEAAIDDYRGEACDGWSEEVDSVCWGVIMQTSTKVGERPRTEEDSCDPSIDTVCDYALLPNIETPATDAWQREVRALRERSEPVAGENLPCPFCGGACDPAGWQSEQTSGPECENCGATAENIEAWNRRTAAPAPAPVVPDDTKRLDWLDAQNKRLNEYYGTAYGWKFDANFQRNAMMLNDSNYPVMTVRQAIDEAMLAAPGKEG